jgi:hypothetical protein
MATASSQTQPSGGRGSAEAVPTFADQPNTPGFLPELTEVVGAGSFEQGGGYYTHLLAREGRRLADELKSAWGRPRVHAGVALQPGCDGYLGVAVERWRGVGASASFSVPSPL